MEHLPGRRYLDYGDAIAVDASGNVYSAGSTDPSGLTSGGFDTSSSGMDAFVARVRLSGTHRWSTWCRFHQHSFLTCHGCLASLLPLPRVGLPSEDFRGAFAVTPGKAALNRFSRLLMAAAVSIVQLSKRVITGVRLARRCRLRLFHVNDDDVGRIDHE